MSEEEKKEFLTEEEIKKLIDMDYSAEQKFYADTAMLQKMKNTIEKIDKDMKSVRGLKRFFQTGVLVNDRLIIAADPDERTSRLGIHLRALGDVSMHSSVSSQVRVDLTINDTTRLARILPAIVKAARFKRDLEALKRLYKNKTERRSRRY